MIVPKRWIKLNEVRQRLLQHVLEEEVGDEVSSGADEHANELCWDFCECSKKVFMHAGGDKAIEYSKAYIEPPKAGKHLQKNELVDLCVGVPGSGSKKFVAVGAGPKIYHVTGPYLGSPILFERKEFEKYFLKLEGAGTASADLSEAGIKKKLLEMHNTGTYTNKEAAWEHFKMVTTSRKFKAGFKAAKKEDTTFGQVGAPSKESKKKHNPNSLSVIT